VRTLRFDRGTLLIDGISPGEEPPGFTWDSRIQRFRGDANQYRHVVLSWHRSGLEWTDHARSYKKLDDLVHHSDRTPRDYQAAALEAWRLRGRNGCIILPTGSGKTLVAELCIADAKRSTLVLAPTIDLVMQWVGVLEKAFQRPIGMLGGGQHVLEDLTVSTYDSAYLHMDKYGGRFGFLICDEVHHLPSQAYAQAALMSLAPWRLGLTATFERPDDAHNDVIELIGPVVYRRGIRELAGEVLAEYTVVNVEVDLTDDEGDRYFEARSTFRSFVRQKRIRLGGRNGWGNFLRAAAMSKAGRAALKAHRESRRVIHEASGKLDALETILKRHPDGRVLLFTNDNATVYRISREFGVPCITHQTDVKERRAILAAFAEGRWRVIATSRVLNEGVDMPDADVGVVLSGTSTVREHVQRLGRLLRPKEGKKAVLYEMVTTGTAEEATSKRRREHAAYEEA
jgi:superfamily II DNA or RNA helicase